MLAENWALWAVGVVLFEFLFVILILFEGSSDLGTSVFKCQCIFLVCGWILCTKSSVQKFAKRKKSFFNQQFSVPADVIKPVCGIVD